MRTQFEHVYMGGVLQPDKGRLPIVARGHRSGAQPIPNGGVVTTVVVNTADDDVHGKLAVGTGIITPGVTGRYRVSAAGYFSGMTAGVRVGILVYKNTLNVAATYAAATTDGVAGVSIGDLLNPSATDQVTIRVQNFDGGERSLTELSVALDAVS